MGAMSNYLEGRMADLTLRGASYATPGEIFMALFTSDPGEDASGSEVAYDGYTRISCGAKPSSAFSGTDANGTTQNQNSITFPAVGGSAQVTITHWALYDAATGGNMLYHGPLTTPKTLDPADVPNFAPNALRLTFD